MAPARTSNWDPVLLISQIVAMQSLHYLTLATLAPPLLAIFAESSALAYEGGAASIGMIMDWREMAGRPTFRLLHGEERWNAFAGTWSGGRRVADSAAQPGVDPIRGWVLAVTWVLACLVDVYYLFVIVRRPRMILDFAATLLFNHLVITTYYAAALPTSLFFWLVVLGSAALTVVLAEQLCVKREMTEGLVVASAPRDGGDEVEMEGLRRV
ncbi:integral membrane protein S linking to the trans Golgi network-domain-containing protein [Vararia minispora EC-137]|uniref:Integral membrane protein S linking to the trans Golgi network-domain-containing protein n=1 Tax=Vararia minispora EC-137 TaxID=1314806 RepID=A0ACB8QED1_9AGAM|nr:integral membrane protein S linking to the trans Golgi network-domain-containing protein [Vararia minispora EC-137]